ncbi:glycosyltransferase family 2 protein [Cypionkella psychrotolerans]|uniref:glycosyltransferase family 2 protein n=1 Tax=Cypionkella psychrotolerans TaxID=1678131 RepID=UPI0006B617B1|nr:glycosyltransferase family 2 protein [Cypionkella psychrotolerans]
MSIGKSRLLARLKNTLRSWNRNRIERLRNKRESQTAYGFNLGVLGIMKNEAMNIDEWVQHYLSMGAGKIFLIDNGSSDDTVRKANAWVAKGVVELVEYPERYRQRQHYWTAFNQLNIARKCQWLVVADLDEFWFCPSGQTLAEQLKGFRDIDVIYGNWRMFGSSGHEMHPASVRQGFTLREPHLYSHGFRKYICRTAIVKTRRSLGIHVVTGARSERTVSDNERFHLNHYPIQSLEYFQKVKMTRGDATKSSNDLVRDMQYFHRYNADCSQQDQLLADLVASGKID